MIETERLLLRPYTLSDFDSLYEIMSDPETMQHYPAPFDEEKTRNWITWNLDNYEKYGFGLWAVILKETGEFIGDCGITLQNIDGEILPEIGYHIHKKYWRRGFAKEAARAVRDWGFRNTQYDIFYSYMKYTNIGSWSTALANGMKKVKEYPDPKNTISYAYAITREEWEKLQQNSSAD
ncbi:GNAT family N-acetyltransferase [Clostridiales bacterium FE2011]|nr:GNAT family N-acetyltransferase [Clostridiales bacterium FE2011]